MDPMKTAIDHLHDAGSSLRMAELLRLGVSRRQLYSLLEQGRIVKLCRGLYRLAELAEPDDPDLTLVAARLPQAVLCLSSALSFHRLTTQVPPVIHLAFPPKTRTPRIDGLFIEAHHFSEASFAAGIEVHPMSGASFRVYDREKTLVDCFKFRHRIGHDLFIEALKFYRSGSAFHGDKLLDYARICRVERQIRPYLEMVQ